MIASAGEPLLIRGFYDHRRVPLALTASYNRVNLRILTKVINQDQTIISSACIGKQVVDALLKIVSSLVNGDNDINIVHFIVPSRPIAIEARSIHSTHSKASLLPSLTLTLRPQH